MNLEKVVLNMNIIPKVETPVKQPDIDKNSEKVVLDEDLAV